MPTTDAVGPRPAQDSTLFGRIERYGPLLTRLTAPRHLIDQGGAPHDRVGLEELREYVLDSGTDLPTRDAVWRWLVPVIRAERGDWYLFAVYLAMPLLRDKAWAIAPVPPFSLDDAEDAQASLALETLNALHRVDLTRRHIAARIIGQAAYHARGGRRKPPQLVPLEQWQIADTSEPTGYPPTPGNPAAVLDRLVRDSAHAAPSRRLDATDAELIAATYLDTTSKGAARSLRAIATELGMQESAARMRRARAITRLARLLGRPDLTAAEAITPSRRPSRRAPTR